ncbi:peroxide stress protein YaaA [Ligilactobacillus sp. LYQ135]
MKIIISPAKQMQVDTDTFDVLSQAALINKTVEIEQYLKSLSDDQLRKLWNTNDKLFDLNLKRIRKMNLNSKHQTPAILAFCGLQYKYMSPDLFTQNALDYIQKNLRILSSFYGVLRPFDGVVPYRLEMRAKAHVNGTKNLHAFWRDSWFKNLTKNNDLIINLASEMYARQVSRYIKNDKVKMITCVFGYFNKQKNKVVSDNTYAKMARGEMVRYMAEKNISNYHELIKFNDFGYQYHSEFSSDTKLTFLRDPEKKGLI